MLFKSIRSWSFFSFLLLVATTLFSIIFTKYLDSIFIAVLSIHNKFQTKLFDQTEKNFAESLEHEDDVVVYTKLPNGFYINTPMGKYNPDWAVAFREGSVKHVYFVAESKGNDLQGSQLRGSEESKIECARRHFKAISDNGYIYDVAKDYRSLYDIVTK